MASTTDYTNLITSEHADKPRFVASVSAVAQALVDLQNTLGEVAQLFDLNVAVGQQLDYDGQWIGLSRTLRAPVVGVYFSFDTADVGFDQGVWQGDSPTYGLVTLDDDTYRTLLIAKALANSGDGTLAIGNAVLALLLAQYPATHAFVQDNLDMSITIGIAGTIPPVLFQYLIEQQYVPIRPGGVGLRDVEIASIDGAPLFGFDLSSDIISGFDTGTWGTVVTF